MYHSLLWLAPILCWSWPLLAITIHLNVQGVNASDWLSVKSYLSADNIDPLTVTELHMDGCHLNQMPLWIVTQTPNVKILGLDNNNISTLPDAIAQLPALEFLFLDHNQLTELPQSLPYLTKLRYLSLSYNQLSHVPQNMAHMTHLKTLHLSGNKLSCLPIQFRSLKGHLKQLSLSNTPHLRDVGNVHALGQKELEDIFGPVVSF
ncbi:MAG: leucine-rich repeat domain-containing protein [Holosporaceae bacterium]